MSKEQKTADTGKGRRNVVKGIAVGAGSVTISQWSKPVVETVVLPAHAQTTAGTVVLQAAQQGAGTLTLIV